MVIKAHMLELEVRSIEDLKVGRALWLEGFQKEAFGQIGSIPQNFLKELTWGELPTLYRKAPWMPLSPSP